MRYCARDMDLVNTALTTLDIERVNIVSILNIVYHKYSKSRVKQKETRLSILSVHPS
jgi:hypothetical protein